MPASDSGQPGKPGVILTAFRQLQRIGYVVAMYSGLRAACNCLFSAFLPKPQVSVLNRQCMQLLPGRSFRIRVNARKGREVSCACGTQVASNLRHPVRHRSPADYKFGMMSLSLLEPEISRWVYRYFCMTSHFGTGHFEIAFYEDHDTVVVFGVRNIVKANAARIGCARSVAGLSIADENDAVAILRSISRTLAANGLQLEYADPQQCVELSVIPSLLHPNRRQRVLSVLRKKYARMWKLAKPDPS